jgi:hypothetical protein
LVTQQETVIAALYDDDGVLDDRVDIDGATTNATYRRIITSPAGERHSGTAGTGAVIDPSSEGTVIAINDAYTEIEYIEITGWTVADYTYAYGISIGNVAGVKIKKCLIHTPDDGGSKRYAAIVKNNTAEGCEIYNNIIYNINQGYTGNKGIHVGAWNDGDCRVYANTVYNCYTGFESENNICDFRNNIGYNCEVAFSSANHHYSSNCTNNLSDDDTAPPLNTYYTGKTLTFTNTDAGTEDFHLVSGDTDAIDLGADLSAYFTDDIDGVTRSGTQDIGADEYNPGAEPPAAIDEGWTPQILKNYREKRRKIKCESRLKNIENNLF